MSLGMDPSDFLVDDGDKGGEGYYYDLGGLCPSPSPSSSAAFDDASVTELLSPMARITQQQKSSPHHMACHDYTNKVCYSSSNASDSASGRQRSSKRPSSSSDFTSPAIKGAGGARKRTKRVTDCAVGRKPISAAGASKTSKAPNKRRVRAGCEDQDYLAHGTGIPR